MSDTRPVGDHLGGDRADRRVPLDVIRVLGEGQAGLGEGVQPPCPFKPGWFHENASSQGVRWKLQLGSGLLSSLMGDRSCGGDQPSASNSVTLAPTPHQAAYGFVC